VSRRTLGLVTIGQTPRPDVEGEFRRFSPDADIALTGALDGLERQEIDKLAVGPQPYPLLTRLADGSTAVIERSRLIPLIETAISRLTRFKPAAIAVLCAGDMPAFKAACPVLIPGILLPGIVKACARTASIGIVTPVAGQVDAARAKWEKDGFAPHVTYASPFDPSEIERAAGEMRAAPIELVVLDCMGHGREYQRRFTELSRRPVLAAQSIVARLAAEFVDSWAGGSPSR
jgi:protein AroM